jgi:Uncharacterised nucleotidyltransferase
VQTELAYLRALFHAAVEDGPPPEPASFQTDWDRVRPWLLGRRLMIPMFAPVVRNSANAPESLKEELLDVTRALHLRNGLLTRELFRILSHLEKAGLDPIVLKGPALARTVYESPLNRCFTDLDVLVRREDCDAAGEILLGLGYRHAQGVMHPEYYERYHFHRCFESPAGIPLELHWDLSRRNDYVRFDLDGFRSRAGSLDTSPVPMRVPAPPDQLLLVAKQELDGGFGDLRRIVDATLLIRAGAASDPSLAERARRQNLGSALWVLLVLVRELASASAPGPDPATLEEGLRPAAFVERCVRSLALPEKALSLYTTRRAGLVHLVRWLCAPDLRSLRKEVAGYVLPRRELLLQMGQDPDHLSGPVARAWLAVRRAWSVAKVCGYQVYRVALHRSRPYRRPA